MTKPGEGDDFYRMNGAGEMLVFSAADFEDFLEPRPDLPPVWSRSSRPWSGTWSRIAGRSACTRPTTSRSAAP